ncbi:hypothetical protein BDV11DRAFT_198325 [Aspergillus similis]
MNKVYHSSVIMPFKTVNWPSDQIIVWGSWILLMSYLLCRSFLLAPASEQPRRGRTKPPIVLRHSVSTVSRVLSHLLLLSCASPKFLQARAGQKRGAAKPKP